MFLNNNQYIQKNLLPSRFFLFYGIICSSYLVLQELLRIVISFNFQNVELIPLCNAGLLQDLSWSSYGMCLLIILGFILGHFGERLAIFIWLTITIITNFADFILLEQWGTRINPQALFYLNNISQAFASLNSVHWVGLIIALLIVFVSSFWAYSALSETIKPPANNRTFSSLIILFLAIVAARGGLGKSPLTIENAMRFKDNQSNQLALNSSWNFLYSLIQGNQIPDVSHFRDSSYFDRNCINKLFPVSGNQNNTHSKNRPHIILIVLEGVSAELSHFFNGKVASVTPNIDGFAREGLSFIKAYATGDRTDKGLVSIFSGWPGQPWQGMLAFPEKSSRLPHMISDLEILDYTTTFYYGSDLHFANQRYYFEQAGIDEIQDISAIKNKSTYQLGSWGIQDADMLKILAERYVSAPIKSNPLFLSLLTLSTHDPYDAVPQNNGSDSQKMIRTVKYLDYELGKFFQRIKKSEKYENTLVVLVSDHGKNLNSKETHFGQKDFFHIPMIFSGGALPSEYRNKKMDCVVSQTDVYSTLFYLLGWSQNEMISTKIFPKGNRSLLKYSRCGLEPGHPNFAWFNIPGVTGVINNNEAFWLGTDKVSINAEKPLNQQDSTILNLSTVIVNDFFKLR